MTPTQAIRAKCLECSGGSSNEVKACPVTGCILHPFRFGKNPNIQLTDEQKAVRAERMRKLTRSNAAKTLKNPNVSAYIAERNDKKSVNPPAEGKFTSEVETPPEST